MSTKDRWRRKIAARNKANEGIPVHERKYTVYDIAKDREVGYTLEELKVLGEELPLKCKAVLERIEGTTHYSMTHQESRDMITLLSLSMSTVWKGSPRGALPEIRMEDYRNEFYIRMMHYLRKFDRSKGCWVAQCRYISCDTIGIYINKFVRGRKQQEKLQQAYARAIAEKMDLYGNELEYPLPPL